MINILRRLKVWFLYRLLRRSPQFELYLPDGAGYSGVLRFQGKDLAGVSRCIIDVHANEVASVTLVIHPSLVKVFAESIDLKLEKLDGWVMDKWLDDKREATKCG